MKVIYCDICGKDCKDSEKVLGERNGVVSFRFDMYINIMGKRNDWEVCYECYDEIYGFIRDRVDEHVSDSERGEEPREVG